MSTTLGVNSENCDLQIARPCVTCTGRYACANHELNMTPERRGGRAARSSRSTVRSRRSAAGPKNSSSRQLISSTIFVIASVGIGLLLLAQLYLGSLMHRGFGDGNGSGIKHSDPIGPDTDQSIDRYRKTLATADTTHLITTTPSHRLISPSQRKPGPTLQPIFRCDDHPTFRRNKLAFVHVFKTAGSTIRNFFDAYSDWCFAGWAIIVGCSTVGIDTIGSSQGAVQWNATHPLEGEPVCSMKRTWNRTGTKRWKVYVNNKYVAQDLDIIGGHLPLGVEDVWQNTVHLPVEVREKIGVTHLTFVRNALDKLVSGTSYKTINPTVETVVEKIRHDVETALADNRFQSKYAEYYITPRQKKEYKEKGLTLSIEELAVQQMANLLEYNVVVGATERMSDSLRLLQSLIDNDGEATELFEEFGMAEKGEGEDRKSKLKQGMVARAEKIEAQTDEELPLVINPSELSTRSIVRKLKKNERLFLDALAFVRYEQQISDFALAMHMRQHEHRPKLRVQDEGA